MKGELGEDTRELFGQACVEGFLARRSVVARGVGAQDPVVPAVGALANLAGKSLHDGQLVLEGFERFHARVEGVVRKGFVDYRFRFKVIHTEVLQSFRHDSEGPKAVAPHHEDKAFGQCLSRACGVGAHVLHEGSEGQRASTDVAEEVSSRNHGFICGRGRNRTSAGRLAFF